MELVAAIGIVMTGLLLVIVLFLYGIGKALDSIRHAVDRLTEEAASGRPRKETK